jgi:hypothetical protein
MGLGSKRCVRSLVLGAVCLVVALIGTGTLYPADQPPSALVQPPGPCSGVPARLAPGSTIAADQLATFDFLTPAVGAGLSAGVTYCVSRSGAAQPTRRAVPVRLVMTTDAGRHWRVEGPSAPPGAGPGTWLAPPTQPLSLGSGANLTAELAFSSVSTGWAEVGGQLSFTANGGGSWQPAHLGGPVAAVAQLGAEALALRWGEWQLWRSSDASGRWQLVSAIPVAPPTTQADIVLGPPAPDVVVATSHYGDTPPLVAQTSDGGRRWRLAQDPCRPPQ